MSNLCPSCREPLYHPSGDGCAAMTKHKEKQMNEHVETPLYIGVEKVTENDDGSATYTFQMDDKTADNMQELGLKLILYCGSTNVDIQDVFDWILAQKPNTQDGED